MSATILVGYDPRSRDRAPVEFGVTLAELSGARLIVASVQAGEPLIGPFPGTALPFAVEPVDEDLVADCSPALAALEPQLRARGITVECRAINGVSAARALRQAAEAADVGLLVVGSGRHVRALGSTAERLLHGAPCPVAAVPRDWTARPLRTIAAAVAGADGDRDVIEAARGLARIAHARLRVLTVLHIIPAGDTEDEFVARAEQALREAVAGDDEVEVEVGAFVGEPVEVLLELSERLDLYVCGSRGYGPLRAVLLGSVSRRLAAESRCPVIVLPHGVQHALGALLGHTAAVA
jgi:nucleotide-binding universal stress UspA family protein